MPRMDSVDRPINLDNGERALSAMGGAGLILAGLLRRSLGGALLAGAGVVLLERGLSGRCQFYAAGNRHRAKTLDRKGEPIAASAAAAAADIVDEASEGSFPASDPPSYASPVSVGRPSSDGADSKETEQKKL